MSRTVKIGELRDRLSAHLRRVKRGEEIIVLDRDRPVARIIPFHATGTEDDAEVAALAREGRVTLPTAELDWRAIDRMPGPKLVGDELLEAVIADRNDR